MITGDDIAGLSARIRTARMVQPVGRVAGVRGGLVSVTGLSESIRIGDRLSLARDGHPPLHSEVVQLDGGTVIALPEDPPAGIAIGARVVPAPPLRIAPAAGWLGRILDPSCHPLDGRPLVQGARDRSLSATPPAAAQRRGLGARLNTGLAVTNTLLPLVRGQRIGLFAGSGVGKSSLLGSLASGMDADVVVLALIGERGRELRHFIEDVLGPDTMRRTVVIAATSDQSALHRRRCAWTAMTVAEHFRDTGASVLLLADSITRFAEAHREIAVASGEAPVLRGYPPSTAHLIMSLCERAGPGQGAQGDITALFSVLVAGSDMEEPIADILRGTLDGHIVLDRAIAERGRFPAVDVLQSVSRSLPKAATEAENEALSETRRLIGLYEQNAVMIRAGLYTQGTDAELDRAVALWPEFESFLTQTGATDCTQSFQQLNLILRRARAAQKPVQRPPQRRNDAA